MSDKASISALLAVHEGVGIGALHMALRSLIKQSAPPNEIVIVWDGVLPRPCQLAIKEVEAEFPGVWKNVELGQNVGLGRALNAGLEVCEGEFVARMDADDVAFPNRLEVQLEFLKRHREVVACSGHVEEWDECLTRCQDVRRVPIGGDELRRFDKRRNPLNHPAVMFRANVIREVGGYPEFRKLQDYALWALLLVRGYELGNVDEILLKMRAGEGLLARRGFRYFLDEVRVFRFHFDIGFLDGWEAFKNLVVRAPVRLSPAFVRVLFYRHARNG